MALLKAVLYERYSGDDTDLTTSSVERQHRLNLEHCQTKGYAVLEDIQEDLKRATSGADLNLPGINRLFQLATNRAFDVLVVTKVDRLARSLAKQMVIEMHMQKHGIVIEYSQENFADTPQGQLHKHLQAVIAEYERLQIVERTRAGVRDAVKSGVIVSGGWAKYGYDRVMVAGKPTLVVNEQQADVVRLIFDLYVIDRLSQGAIADKLSELQIPTWADIHGDKNLGATAKARPFGEWVHVSVGHILRSRAYIGEWEYGDIGTGVPPIVTPATFEAAQKLMKDNKQRTVGNTKFPYLLSRRLTCGACEYSMRSTVGRVYRYYVCPGRTKAGGRVKQGCTLPYLRINRVEPIVWAWVERLLTGQEKLEELIASYQGKHRVIFERIDTVQATILEKKAELEAYISALGQVRGHAREALIQTINVNENAIDHLTAVVEGLIAEVAEVVFTPEDIKTAAESLQALASELDTIRDDPKKRRQLVDRLNLTGTFRIEDDWVVLDVVCVLRADVLPIQAIVNSHTSTREPVHEISLYQTLRIIPVNEARR